MNIFGSKRNFQKPQETEPRNLNFHLSFGHGNQFLNVDSQTSSREHSLQGKRMEKIVET